MTLWWRRFLRWVRGPVPAPTPWRDQPTPAGMSRPRFVNGRCDCCAQWAQFCLCSPWPFCKRAHG